MTSTLNSASIIGSPFSNTSIPNMPWEDRPEGHDRVLWRYSGNPIINHNDTATSNSIFNSAVVPYGDGFAGVFRIDTNTRLQQLHAGFSPDGVNWTINDERIQWEAHDERTREIMPFQYAYDPRVVWIEEDQRYYVIWCNGYVGPALGFGYTTDFKTFTQMDNTHLPYNRNGVLFPRKINGNYVMLNRPSDNGHTPFGDIYLSASPDLIYWGRHRHVMSASSGWQATKVGAGPIPIETTEGWLMIYHGVLTSCNGFVYSFGAALLDLDEPWKVVARGDAYLLAPQAEYERTGDVPNVAFPCAALTDSDTGRIAIYYGAADTVVCVAFGYVDEIIDFIKTKSQ